MNIQKTVSYNSFKSQFSKVAAACAEKSAKEIAPEAGANVMKLYTTVMQAAAKNGYKNIMSVQQVTENMVGSQHAIALHNLKYLLGLSK